MVSFQTRRGHLWPMMVWLFSHKPCRCAAWHFPTRFFFFCSPPLAFLRYGCRSGPLQLLAVSTPPFGWPCAAPAWRWLYAAAPWLLFLPHFAPLALWACPSPRCPPSLWLSLALGASALLLSAIERRRERWILSMSGLALVFVSRFLSARVLVTLNAFAPGTACKIGIWGVCVCGGHICC